MSTINPDMHLADIVVANPATARVFEQHRIDYCCHGDRPLAAACGDAGVDTAEIVRELEHLETDSMAELPTNDVGALIGHIVGTHHTYLRRELPRLRVLSDKVLAAHGSAHPVVEEVAVLLSELTADLLPHLAKEEQVLFPIAIQLLGAVEPTTFHCGRVTNPIRVMLAEHDRTGELLDALRRATDDYTLPSDACPTWRALYDRLTELEADTHRHVHLENHVLFPAITDLEEQLDPGR